MLAALTPHEYLVRPMNIEYYQQETSKNPKVNSLAQKDCLAAQSSVVEIVVDALKRGSSWHHNCGRSKATVVYHQIERTEAAGADTRLVCETCR